MSSPALVASSKAKAASLPATRTCSSLPLLLQAVERAVELCDLRTGGAHLGADGILDGGAVGIERDHLGGAAAGDEVDVTVHGGEDRVAAGGRTSFAKTSSGKVLGWGANEYG